MPQRSARTSTEGEGCACGNDGASDGVADEAAMGACLSWLQRRHDPEPESGVGVSPFDRGVWLVPVRKLLSLLFPAPSAAVVGFHHLEEVRVMRILKRLGDDIDDRCPSCSRKRQTVTITPHCIAALRKNRAIAVQCKHCSTTHPYMGARPPKPLAPRVQ